MVADILHGKSEKFLIIAGPCSWENHESDVNLGIKLAELNRQLKHCFVIYRGGHSKPRSLPKAGKPETSFFGKLFQPEPGNGFDVAEGVVQVTKLYADLANAGVPLAVEMLNAVFAQMFSPYLTFGWAGARDVTSTDARAGGSISSMPFGAKNFIYGGVRAVRSAIDTLLAARVGHPVLAPDSKGQTTCFESAGNPDAAAVILRGFQDTGPNYNEEWAVKIVSEQARAAGLDGMSIIVDCSHDNCPRNSEGKKIPLGQLEVVHEVLRQRIAGNPWLVGVMIETNWEEGTQPFPKKGETPKPGLSITDPCMSVDQLIPAILEIDSQL